MGGIGHMGDERIEAGAPFRRIDAGHGVRIARIGAEPIDRLGGKGDDPASPDEGTGLGDLPVFMGMKTLRLPLGKGGGLAQRSHVWPPFAASLQREVAGGMPLAKVICDESLSVRVLTKAVARSELSPARSVRL